MSDSVERMLAQLGSGQRPPLELWQPPLSGDIDIRIDADGQWYHDGGLIERFKLVKLFASIMRYEADIGFVLVTPVEKWKIRVEDAPFIAVAMARRQQQGKDSLVFVTNVGEEFCAGPEHPIELCGEPGRVGPYIAIRDGLTAKLSRPVYYELAESAVECGGVAGVWSGGEFYALDKTVADN
jgi:hypothetical protein